MRTRRWSVAGVALVVGTLAPAISVSQMQGDSDPLAALRDGRLVVWVLAPAKPPKTGFEVVAELNHQTPLNYKEQTNGSFGQSASTYGQSAASYGVPSDSPAISTTRPTSNRDPAADSQSPEYKEQTSGSFGQSSGGFGTVASEHGKTSGSVGQSASTYGATASNYGQTASSLTEDSGTASGLTNKIQQARDGASRPLSDAVQQYLQPRLAERFAGLQVEYSDVYPEELQARLKEVAGMEAYPDVLMGPVPAEWMRDERSRMVLATVKQATFFDDGVTQGSTTGARVYGAQVTIVAKAPHMAVAQAFALWMSEVGGCDGCVEGHKDGQGKLVASTARDAVMRILRGEGLGDMADREMAAFPQQLGRTVMMLTSGSSGDGAPMRVEAMQSSVNGRLATVELRVVASSDRVFGLVHPLVVLRRGRDGQWRVLHVSLNLPVAEQEGAYDVLRSPEAAGDGHAALAGVVLASPVDGDRRPPLPELWWNNGGGAGLQVVEWQRCFGAGCTEARLFLVPDRGARLQTRVTAKFAGSEGQYRWRVWSVGAGGETKITPWWKMTIAR